MHSSGDWHHMQGVWGAARPPSGEREGRSRLAWMQTSVSGGRVGSARPHPRSGTPRLRGKADQCKNHFDRTHPRRNINE